MIHSSRQFKNKLRIALVDAGFDRLLRPVYRNLYDACHKEGMDPVVIAGDDAYDAYFKDNKNCININGEKVPFYLCTRKEQKKVNIERHVEAAFCYWVLRGVRERQDRLKIRSSLLKWFSEAVVLLKVVAPDMIVIWNGSLLKRAMYTEAARILGIRLFFAERGFLPQSWFIDPLGIGAQSALSAQSHFDCSEEMIVSWKDKFKQIDGRGESAWEQPLLAEHGSIKKKIGVTSGQKIIFFPGQVDYDSNMIFYSPYFKTSAKALEWLAATLPADNFFILAKPHPKGSDSVETFQRLLGGKGKALEDINVTDAINLSACTVTINSTVAFEAAIRGKPVIMLGQGILSGKDFIYSFTERPPSFKQIEDCLQAYEAQKNEKLKNAECFAAYLHSCCYGYRDDLQSYARIAKRLAHIYGPQGETIKRSLFGNFFLLRVFCDISRIKSWLRRFNKKLFTRGEGVAWNIR